MDIEFEYDETKYSKDDYHLLPEGNYRVKIVSLDYKQTAKCYDMHILKLKTLDVPGTLFYNLVIIPDSDMTHQNLGRIYDSFNIDKRDRHNTSLWLDAEGAAEVTHEEYMGKVKARVKSFLTQEKQEELGLRGGEYATAPEEEHETADIPF